MNKVKKLFIIIIVIFLIFCLFLGIKAIVNYNKLRSIINKQIEYIDKDNYSLKTNIKNGEKKSETMSYYRKGIGRQVAENGIYTWTDGKDAYMIDEVNKVVYVLDIKKNSEMLVSSDKFAYLIPGYNEKFFKKLKICGNLFNSIKSESIGEEECYKITVQEEKYKKVIWVSKKNYVPIKATMEFPSGELFEYTYDLRFTSTKITSIEMPDLDDYKIVDYETKNVIVEKFVTDESEETNTIEN